MRLFLYSVCIFSVFEYTSLASLAGVFTGSLAMVFFPVVVFVIFFRFSSIDPICVRLLIVLLSSFFYSIVLLFFFLDVPNVYFLLDRGVRFFLLSIPPAVFFVFFSLYDGDALKKAILVFSLFVIFVFLTNLIFPEFYNSASFFHYKPAFSPDRLRGFTLEASTFGFQVGLAALFLCSFLRVNVLIGGLLSLLLVFITTSKGGVVALSLSFALSLFVFSSNRQKVFVLILFGFLVPVLFVNLLFPLFQSDIESYSSSATRLTLILSSLYNLVIMPFGSGYFGYLPAVYNNGPEAVSILNDIAPGLFNFYEVDEYFFFGVYENISTKSFFFDWVIYFGLFFVFLFFKVVFWYVRYLKSLGFYYFQIFVFIILCVSTYLPLDGRFIVPLFLSFFMVTVRNKILTK